MAVDNQRVAKGRFVAVSYESAIGGLRDANPSVLWQQIQRVWIPNFAGDDSNLRVRRLQTPRAALGIALCGITNRSVRCLQFL